MTTVVGLSALVGLLLGMLGGGGSILLLPVLVYVAGMEPKAAIATTLVVVAVTSVTAVISHARGGRVCWKTGALFGLAGMLGAYAGGRLAAFVPSHLLLLLFAGVTLATGIIMMLRRPATTTRTAQRVCPVNLPVLPIMVDGLLVGAVTGLVGVGGGFVVVPALNILGGLPMHAAVGTSLLVVVMTSVAALLGYSSHVELDIPFVTVITTAAVAGSLLGGLFSSLLRGPLLRRAFGLFVLGIAVYLLKRELSWQVFEELENLLSRHADYLRGCLSIVGLLAIQRLWRWTHRALPHLKPR